ncbi:DUF6385 domain-containing protein [Cohnella soli]|uniref:DUF6385 domain-containing protein n=1 Tax=Cohnella soli TaxID=425005 RepID=A0ABW0HUE0_9BACL
MGKRTVCRPKRGKPRLRKRKPKTCRIRRSPAPPPFFTQKQVLSIEANGSMQYSQPIDVSRQSLYTFGIVNKGDKAVVAQVEISPDSVNYAKDAEEIIPGGTTFALVPMRFLRFARISVRTVDPTAKSHVDVYFQAQAAG